MITCFSQYFFIVVHIVCMYLRMYAYGCGCWLTLANCPAVFVAVTTRWMFVSFVSSLSLCVCVCVCVCVCCVCVCLCVVGSYPTMEIVFLCSIQVYLVLWNGIYTEGGLSQCKVSFLDPFRAVGRHLSKRAWM